MTEPSEPTFITPGGSELTAAQKQALLGMVDDFLAGETPRSTSRPLLELVPPLSTADGDTPKIVGGCP
jgi:hypothetical protein